MNKLNAGIGVLLGGFFALNSPQDPTATPDKPTVVVGTYDSRGIAIAYVGSTAFNRYVSAQKADIDRVLKRAKAATDQRLVKNLEALGPAMQQRIHQQGFGTAPVDDILARIQSKLPGIAKKAGVDVIVSKWNLTYRSPSAKFVDVTKLLAVEFDASERTLKSVRQIMAKDPVPLDQLKGRR